jgi:hypothetical protein
MERVVGCAFYKLGNRSQSCENHVLSAITLSVRCVRVRQVAVGRMVRGSNCAFVLGDISAQSIMCC